MNDRVIFGKEGSDESSTSEQFDARNVAWRPTCPECGGSVISEDHEAVCGECGLVVTIDVLERAPTLQAHAPDTVDRAGEWAVEPTTALRVDNGLHTTFFLGTDGKGTPLTFKQKKRYGKLRKRHKRFQMETRRDNRLNEGFRDIGMLGANLELPDHVQADAASFLRAAKAERLPGGRMAWESLAGGAVLLAARRAGFERAPEDVAFYAKSSEERVCAAARKIRMKTDVEAPPVRDRVVERVVGGLEDAGIGVATGLELARIADGLLDLADSEPIGPGTPRMTVAGAAVYAADRLTDGKAVTQADVVTAIESVVPTSKSKIASYSQELYDVGADTVRVRDATARSAAAD